MKSTLKTTAIGLAMLAVAGCSTTGTLTNPLNNSGKLNSKLGVIAGSEDAQGLDPIARAAFWGTRFDREPGNAEAAVNFSKSLRAIGSNAESLDVINRTARTQPDNPAVQLELGKSLIASDRAFEAIRPLEKAVTTSRGRSWETYSAYGVALDKIGEHREARKQYDLALALNPGAYEVYNNKGLSFALSGRLDLAERTLREAAAHPQGTAKVRQNLALVLGFKGNTAEAERLARSDLPPVVANNNIAYYRSLVSKPAYWRGAGNDNVELPSFDTPAEVAPSFESVPFPAEETPAVVPQELQPLPTPEPVEEETSPLAQPAPGTLKGSGWANVTPAAASGAPVPLENTSEEAAAKDETDDKEPVEDENTGA